MAVAFRKLQSASSSSAGARLDVARSEYQATEKRVGEVEKARVTAILADTNDVARKLDGEVEALQRDFRIQRDRVKLLEDEVAREANDRRNQEIEAQNKQVDALFDQRDEAIGKLAACMKQEVKLWRQVLDANRKIVAAHSWSAADLSACMLSPLAVGSALSFESYRQSYTPRKFGGQVESADAGLSLPGSRSPKLEWLEWPERIVPLQDIFHEAGEYGKQVLRGKRPTAQVDVPVPVMNGDAVAAPVTNGGDPPVQRTEAEQQLNIALQELSQAAEDCSVEGELRYKAKLERVIQLQDAAAAGQRIGAQGNA